ncbi:MAG TPA: oligosaccharide flippase family protein [Armatimonadota bacterium]|nr:oligosaccharide flippase family protein [Armatimonadota bacterium]
MLEERGVGQSIGVVGSGRSIYVLSLFVLNIGLARSMGVEGFGAFQQVFMFSAFFVVLTLGIPDTLYFFLPRLTTEERPGFLGQTILLMALNGLALSLLLWIGAPWLAHLQNNPDITSNIRIFGVYGAFYVASAFADPIFITFKRVRYLFLLSASHGLLFIALTVWQYITGVSASALFTVMAAFAVVKFLLAFLLVRHMRPIIGNIDWFGGKRTVLLQLSFALPVALSSTIDIISTWMDKFVVSFYLGKEALGVFYVGAIEIPLVAVLLSSTYSVVSPVLGSMQHRGDYTGFADLVKQTFLFTAKFIWPLWLYLLVFADRLIPMVFGPEYTASVLPFRIYLALMPLRIALYGAIIVALGKPHVVSWTALGALLLNLALNIILVTRIGLAGPAIATVISSYVHVVVLLWVVMRATGAGLPKLVPFRGLLEILAVSGLAAALSFPLTGTGILESDFQAVAVSTVVFIGAYVFFGKKAGFIRLLSLRDIREGRFGGGKSGSLGNQG